MQRLRKDFVTCWVLAKDLPALAESAADPAVRKLAAQAHEKYQYPVDSQIWSPAGELLAQKATNDLFDDMHGHYLRLLDAAVRDE